MPIVKSRWLLVALAILLLTPVALAQPSSEDLLRDMRWRNLGPGNFAGRVVDVEALESDFRYVLCASASGGVWKSVNAGATWEPIFDNYGSASIGDVAIFQKDRNIIWVGAGEANNRNSVAWGDGIYKSTDGGKTFTNVGLRDTYQIARIVTHPTDPNIVYVAAIGNLWAYNGDRGLFKSTDGGKSWSKLAGGLPNDGKTGATDLVMHPGNPNTLYVAFYQRLRQPWRFDSGGPNGGIFKSTDAGKTWKKLITGLPTGDTGRIGLTVHRKNPKIVMAMIEHGNRPAEDHADYADMTKLGTGVYRSEDAGATWRFVNRYNNRPFYYSQIHIDPHDHQRVYLLTTTIRISRDGGRTFVPGDASFEGGLDYHAMWHDPVTPGRYYLGKDKGLTLTHDGGETFILFDNMPIGQFYAVGLDMRDPYMVCGGTQDNGTWCGPHFSRDVRGTQNDSFWKLHWGDGMFIQIDPADWRKAYTEAENGSFRRYDMFTHSIEPSAPVPQNITNYSDVVKEKPRNPRQLPDENFRFNWRAPLVMSPHSSSTLYLGGNYLFRTTDSGRQWEIISPDLSTNDPKKTDPNTGGLTRDATGAETHCSITAISESPVSKGVIWIGTDDGNIQVTRDNGAMWSNVRSHITGVPDGIWVSSVEASHFDAAVAYVTFDGHRSSDFRSFLFKTSDYGATWTDLSGGFPQRQSPASPHGHALYVVREDLRNRNLLFAGSEFAVFISQDGGQTWRYFINGFPTVAVHDLVIHPRDNDLVAGTHGRGFWVLDDITPLQQLTPEVQAQAAHLFEQRPATIWEDQSRGGVRGHFYFAAPNPPYIPERSEASKVRGRLESGALINYYLREPARDVVLTILDEEGNLVRTLDVVGNPGINRAVWDLRAEPSAEQKAQFIGRIQRAVERLETAPATTAQQKQWLVKFREQFKAAKTHAQFAALHEQLQAQFPAVNFGNLPRGPEVTPGAYRLRLEAGPASATGALTVRPDPMLAIR
ncbi:MAG: VPS10 domain-containing protein [Candidatus Acidiferrales bacterium]